MIKLELKKRKNTTNDLTDVFKKGIESSEGYNGNKFIRDVNKYTKYHCDDADESNWILIWENIGQRSIIFAFVSQIYPVALIKKECPEIIIQFLKDNNIHIADFREPFSCDEEVLRKYKFGKNILDDRFLDNDDFSLDDDRLFYIYNNIKYVTPYSFTFEEIR